MSSQRYLRWGRQRYWSWLTTGENTRFDLHRGGPIKTNNELEFLKSYWGSKHFSQSNDISVPPSISTLLRGKNDNMYHLYSNSAYTISIRWILTSIKSFMALHPVPYFLLGLQWEWQGFLKLNAYTKGQVTTYNSLFEQKLRQIILEIFCFPLSALLSVSCGLSLFSHHWPLHIEPHSFSLSVLVSCSSSLFHSFHILFSRLSPIFTLFFPSCLFLFSFQVFWSTAQFLQQGL